MVLISSNHLHMLIFFLLFSFPIFFASSVAGGAVSRVDPDSTGLNPSWRTAIAEVYTAVDWEEGANSTTILAAIEQLQKGTDQLDTLTQDSGSYLNEVRKINIKHILIIARVIYLIFLFWEKLGFASRTRFQEIVFRISLPQVERDKGEIRPFVFIRRGLWSGLGRVGCGVTLSQGRLTSRLTNAV